MRFRNETTRAIIARMPNKVTQPLIDLTASLVSATLLAQPVLAGVIAFLILGEELTLWQIFGGLIVVVGIYTVHFAKKKNKKCGQT